MTGAGENEPFGMTGYGVSNRHKSGRPMVAPTNRKLTYKSINGTFIKVFCHVELAETSRGSVA